MDNGSNEENLDGNQTASSDDRTSMRRTRWGVVIIVSMSLVACGTSVDDAGPSAASTLPPVATTSTVVAGDGAEIRTRLPVAVDAWVRQPASGQTIAAAYVTFVNAGSDDVALLDVTSSTGRAELHETVADDDGVMRMQHRPDGFVVPANGELAMAPGGVHVMLFDVDVLDLATARTVALRFDFGPVGNVEVDAPVRADTLAPDDDRDDDQADTGHAAHDHDAHDHGAPDDDASTFDPGVLHDLDDELHAGVIEPERQRAVVARIRAAFLALDEVPDEVDVDEFLRVLDRLDDALAAGDRAAAAALAFEAHDLGHAVYPHDHDHDHDHDHGHDHDHDHDH